MRERHVQKIVEIDFHRNGIAGTGFHVVRFRSAVDGEPKARSFVAVVFPERGRVAVLDAGLLRTTVDKWRNAWCGDRFERELREAIAAWEAERERKRKAEEAADREARAKARR